MLTYYPTLLTVVVLGSTLSAAMPPLSRRKPGCRARNHGSGQGQHALGELSDNGGQSETVPQVTTYAAISSNSIQDQPSSSLQSAPSSTSASTPETANAAPVIEGDTSPVGLALDWESKCDSSSFGPQVSWYYSWAMYPLDGTDGLEFVPMVKNKEMADGFTADQLGQAKYVLSLNERKSSNS